MKVKLDIPYPEIKVESQDAYYADVLSQDYAGVVSETTAALGYSFQHFDKFKEDEEFSDIVEEISIVEMHHLEMLGKLIKLLGKDPVYKTCEASRGDCVMWSADNINYNNDVRKMLEIDIASEKAAIRNYTRHKDIIKDKYIDAILERIIKDEERHLEIFELLYITRK